MELRAEADAASTPRQRDLNWIEHDNTPQLPCGSVVAGSSLGQQTKSLYFATKRELMQNCTIGFRCASSIDWPENLRPV
jgi:hypothetical protein